MSASEQDFIRRVAGVIQTAGERVVAGDTDGAIALLRQVLQAVPGLVQVRELLAGLLTQLGRHGEASGEYDAITAALTADGTPDSLHQAALYYKNLYASSKWQPASEGLIERAIDLWQQACIDRLDLCYLGGVTLCEIGFHEEASLLFAQGRAIQARMAEQMGSTDCRLRFVLGDTAISATIPGIPNMMTGIGHIAFLDYFLKAVRLGWLGDVEPVMLVKDSPVVNSYFLDLFRPLLRIVEDQGEIERLRPLAQAHEVMLNTEMVLQGRPMWTLHATAAVETEWDRRGLGPLLAIPPADRARVREAMSGWGMGPDDWYVCLHVRDNGFRRERELCSENRGLDNTNNADVATFEAAIDAVIAHGGWVVRLGDPGMVPLPFARDRLIDYARGPQKSAFMDVALCAGCRFFIGTSSGLSILPRLFGRATLHTNWTPPYARPWGGDDLFLPKLLRDNVSGRLLPFLDAWRKPIGRSFRPEIFVSRGLSVMDNDSADILAATQEMLDRLNRSDPGDTADQAALRRRYDDLGRLAAVPQGGYGTNSRISRAFLERHRDLLPD